MSDSLFPGSTDLGYAMDAARYAQAAQISSQKGVWNPSVNKKERDNTNLTFEDMLLLMVTQLQNQTIDNQADTNDMMNQLIQMTVMQALTEMSTQVEDLTNANVMSYAASLVGKEVTIGVVDPRTGALSQEIVGKVTATGVYNGQQVVFIGDKYYPLSSIMAVGNLPEQAVDGTTGSSSSEGTSRVTTLKDGTIMTRRDYKEEDENGEKITVHEIILASADGKTITQIRTTGTVTVNHDMDPPQITCDTTEGGYTVVETAGADGDTYLRNEGGTVTTRTDGVSTWAGGETIHEKPVDDDDKTVTGGGNGNSGSGDGGDDKTVPGDGDGSGDKTVTGGENGNGDGGDPTGASLTYRSVNGILVPMDLPVED